MQKIINKFMILLVTGCIGFGELKPKSVMRGVHRSVRSVFGCFFDWIEIIEFKKIRIELGPKKTEPNQKF